jgi:hypothetical protein
LSTESAPGVEPLRRAMVSLNFSENYIDKAMAMFCSDLADGNPYFLYVWSTTDSRVPPLNSLQIRRASEVSLVLLSAMKHVGFSNDYDMVADRLAEGLVAEDESPRCLTDSQWVRDWQRLRGDLIKCGWPSELAATVARYKTRVRPHWNKEPACWSWRNVLKMRLMLEEMLKGLGWSASVSSKIAEEHSVFLGIGLSPGFYLLNSDALKKIRMKHPDWVEQFNTGSRDLQGFLVQRVKLSPGLAQQYAIEVWSRILWAWLMGEERPFTEFGALPPRGSPAGAAVMTGPSSWSGGRRGLWGPCRRLVDFCREHPEWGYNPDEMAAAYDGAPPEVQDECQREYLRLRGLVRS